MTDDIGRQMAWEKVLASVKGHRIERINVHVGSSGFVGDTYTRPEHAIYMSCQCGEAFESDDFGSDDLPDGYGIHIARLVFAAVVP